MKRLIASFMLPALVLTAAGTASFFQPATVYAEQPAVALQWETPSTARYFSDPKTGPDGTVYLATSDREGHTHPLTLNAYAPNGKIKWTLPTEYDQMLYVPASGPNGGVYVKMEGFLEHLDADGQVKWKQETQSVSQIAEGPDGTVYTLAYLGLSAYTPEGKLKWTADKHLNPFLLVVDQDGTAYALADSAASGLTAFAVSADGQNKRDIPLASEGDASLQAANGTLYTWGAKNGSTTVHAFKADGTLLWKTTVPGTGDYPSVPHVDGSGSLTFAANDWQTGQGTLTTLDSEGTITWQYTPGPHLMIKGAPAFAKDGTIYMSVENNVKAPGEVLYQDSVYALQANGTPKWEYPHLYLASAPAAGPNGSVVLTENFNLMALSDTALAPKPLTVIVNGTLVQFPDAQPFVNADQRTMVPVRFVTEQLGAQLEWNDASQSVRIHLGDQDVWLKIGEKQAVVNGKTVSFDTSAIMKDDRTYVPLRFLVETLGAKVEWNETENQVSITR